MPEVSWVRHVSLVLFLLGMAASQANAHEDKQDLAAISLLNAQDVSFHQPKTSHECSDEYLLLFRLRDIALFLKFIMSS